MMTLFEYYSNQHILMNKWKNGSIVSDSQVNIDYAAYRQQANRTFVILSQFG